MISQHHTLKFRVFISCLYITRAISSPTCECTDSGKCKTVESLACLQGRLSNVELLPLACYKIPSFPLHRAIVRLSETTLTLGEKTTSELNIALRISPTVWKPLPQGHTLSPTSQWSQKDCSWERKTMNFLFTGISWRPRSLSLVPHYITSVLSGLWRISHITWYSLGCEGFVFFSGKHSAIHCLSRSKEEEVQQILLFKVGPELCKWVETKSRNRWF